MSAEFGRAMLATLQADRDSLTEARYNLQRLLNGIDPSPRLETSLAGAIAAVDEDLQTINDRIEANSIVIAQSEDSTLLTEHDEYESLARQDQEHARALGEDREAQELSPDTVVDSDLVEEYIDEYSELMFGPKSQQTTKTMKASALPHLLKTSIAVRKTMRLVEVGSALPLLATLLLPPAIASVIAVPQKNQTLSSDSPSVPHW